MPGRVFVQLQKLYVLQHLHDPGIQYIILLLQKQQNEISLLAYKC